MIIGVDTVILSDPGEFFLEKKENERLRK